MGVLDALNGRWGRGTMRLASAPVDMSASLAQQNIGRFLMHRYNWQWPHQ
ncbi:MULTISPECIES: DUF4113 domain-containing protein [Pseudomonas]|nr:DUF4113 domain-containing protein [Pseudomonas sp. Irchel 3F5]